MALAVSVAHANTLQVPEQFGTIQAGLDAGAPGDTISVAPGVYYENVVFPTDGLALLARVRHQATIDGGGTGKVVTINNRTATVEGFVVTGGGASSIDAGIWTSQKFQGIRHNIVTGNASNGITLSSWSQAGIVGNEVFGNGRAGIQLHAADAFIANNLVYANEQGVSVFGRADIVNNTIQDNVVNLEVDESNALIANNIVAGGAWGIWFWGYYASDITAYVAGFLRIHHNDFWNNEVDYHALLGLAPYNEGPFDPLPGGGQIAADPQLVGGGNLRLLPTSPCIDAGGNLAASGILTDFDGNPRFVGTVDIGAFEYQGASDVRLEAESDRAGWSVDVSPSPFRTGTRIRFSLAEESHVTLRIHDVAGRLVRMLVRARVAPGDHGAIWDGRDEAGAKVGGGTYFVRLAAGDVVRVRKVIYLGP